MGTHFFNMSPTTKRWGSPGVSGELSRGSRASGGGKKPESWGSGEKGKSEAEPRRVLEEDSAAETGVGRDMCVGREERRGGDG